MAVALLSSASSQVGRESQGALSTPSPEPSHHLQTHPRPTLNLLTIMSRLHDRLRRSRQRPETHEQSLTGARGAPARTGISDDDTVERRSRSPPRQRSVMGLFNRIRGKPPRREHAASPHADIRESHYRVADTPQRESRPSAGRRLFNWARTLRHRHRLQNHDGALDSHADHGTALEGSRDHGGGTSNPNDPHVEEIGDWPFADLNLDISPSRNRPRSRDRLRNHDGPTAPQSDRIGANSSHTDHRIVPEGSRDHGGGTSDPQSDRQTLPEGLRDRVGAHSSHADHHTVPEGSRDSWHGGSTSSTLVDDGVEWPFANMNLEFSPPPTDRLQSDEMAVLRESYRRGGRPPLYGVGEFPELLFPFAQDYFHNVYAKGVKIVVYRIKEQNDTLPYHWETYRQAVHDGIWYANTDLLHWATEARRSMKVLLSVYNELDLGLRGLLGGTRIQIYWLRRAAIRDHRGRVIQHPCNSTVRQGWRRCLERLEVVLRVSQEAHERFRPKLDYARSCKRAIDDTISELKVDAPVYDLTDMAPPTEEEEALARRYFQKPYDMAKVGAEGPEATYGELELLEHWPGDQDLTPGLVPTMAEGLEMVSNVIDDHLHRGERRLRERDR